jgi:hypothetical protein
MATPFCVLVLATFIKTNQNPNSERQREALPLTIWVLCPNKNGEIIKELQFQLSQVQKDRTWEKGL